MPQDDIDYGKMFGKQLDIPADVTATPSGQALPKPVPNDPVDSPYKDAIIKSEQFNGIPNGLLNHLLYTESGFDPAARNKISGATGIAQVLPGTAANPGYNIAPVDPTDPNASIDFAGKYLRARYNVAGSWKGAVQGYGTIGTGGPANDRQQQLWNMADLADKPAAPIDYGQMFSKQLGTSMPQPEQDKGSYLGRLFKHSALGVEQLGLDLAALTTRIAGDDQATQDIMSAADRMGKRMDELGPKYKTWADLRKNGTMGDWMDSLFFAGADAIPDIAMMVGTGGIGSLLVKQGLKVGGKELAEEMLKKYALRGALAGNYLAATGIETGRITGEQYQATGKINPGVAIAAGAIAGVPAAFTPGAIASRLGIAPKIANDFVSFISTGVQRAFGTGWAPRMFGSMLGYGLENAAATGVQSTVESLARSWVDQNYHVLGPEGVSRVWNDVISGGVMGGLLGAAVPARDMRVKALEDHLRDRIAGGEGDPNYKASLPQTTDGTEALKKWLPESENKSVEALQQVMREQFGDPTKIPAWQKKQLEDNPQTLDSFNILKSAIESHIRGFMLDKVVTSDDGQGMKVGRANVNLKDETIALHDDTPTGTLTKTMPLSELPLRDLAKQAINFLDKSKSSWMNRAFPGIANPYGGARTGHSLPWDHINNAHAGDPATDRMNRPVDLTQGLKPGQVAYSWDRTSGASQSPIAPHIRRFIEGVVKRFAPGASVLIDSRDRLMNPVIPGMGGFINAIDKGQYYISLPIEPNLIQATTTMFHELGHLVAFHNWDKLSIGGKQILYAAYSKQLKDWSGKDLKEFFQQTLHPTRMGWIWDEAQTKAAAEWYDFDEWAAENFATHFMFGPGMNATDKFFGKISSKFVDLLNETKKIAPGWNPPVHEAMAGWLNSIYTDRNPHIAESFLQHVMQSSAENAKAMGMALDPSQSSFDRVTMAPPHSSSNWGLNKLTGLLKAQGDKFSWYTKWIWNTHQVAELNRHIKPLAWVADSLSMLHADRMQWANRANDVLVAWRNLGKDRAAKLDQYQWALDSRIYLKKNEANRMPTMAESSKMLKDIGVTPEDWRQMKPVHDGITQMFGDSLKRMYDSAIIEAQKIKDPVNQTKRIQEINTEFAALQSKPYFPHSRYGDHYVAVKDTKGKLIHYELVWGARPADKRAAELKAQYSGSHPGSTVFPSKVPAEMREYIGLPAMALNKLRNMPGLSTKQQEFIDDFIYEGSSANSFIQRMQRRKDIAGYDLNAPRSFATYFRSASGHLARLKFQGQIEQGVKDLQDTVGSDPSLKSAVDRSKRQKMADWLDAETKYILHPPSENAAIRSFAFQWWLGFNPSTAFVHLMQMPMFTYPYMSKYYGVLGGTKHMLGAYADMLNLYKDPAKSGFDPGFVQGQSRAQHEGLFTENRGTDIAALADEGLLARATQGTQIHRSLMRAANVTSYFMRTIEKNNRLVTWRAAWNAAKENLANPMVQDLIRQHDGLYKQLIAGDPRAGIQPMHPTDAAAYIAARHAVQQTHFMYTQVARPAMFRGPVMSKISTFMMYKQQALWFYRHNPAGLRALLALGAVAGVQGMPFEEDISDFTKWISEWIGERFDPNEWLRKHVAELTDHPETIMHGYGQNGLGMNTLFNSVGLPGFLGDVSRRLGYGAIIPGVNEFTRDQQENFMERFGNVAGAVAGGGLGVPIQVGSALSKLNVVYAMQRLLEDGDWSGFRGLEPVIPSVLRNVMMASRYATEGGDIRPGGMSTPMNILDPIGQTQIVARALGFSSPQVAQKLEAQDERSQVDAYWMLRRANIMQNFVQARIMKDSNTAKDTLERVKQYNEDVPYPKLKIKASALVAGLKRKMLTDAMAARGMDRQGVMQNVIRQQFPELQPEELGTGMPPSPQGPLF